jgi:hypothetical protein
MTCWEPWSRGISRLQVIRLLAVAPVLFIVACAPPRDDAYVAKTALLPADLAVQFLRGIKSRTSPSMLGSETVPPCRFTEKGAWSGGEYRRLTGQRGPSQVTNYEEWILVKVEDAAGRALLPAELDTPNAWNYWLRTPRTARTMFGTTDHCIIGPSTEPTRKVVEALVAAGVAVVPEYRYIVR